MLAAWKILFACAEMAFVAGAFFAGYRLGWKDGFSDQRARLPMVIYVRDEPPAGQE